MTGSDSKENKKPLTLSTNTLGLKKGIDSQVRQSFAHGRSKTVTVEVKKKRDLLRNSSQNRDPNAQTASSAGLTKEEIDLRLKALQGAIQAQAADAERLRRPSEVDQKATQEEDVPTENNEQNSVETPVKEDAKHVPEEVIIEEIAPVVEKTTAPVKQKAAVYSSYADEEDEKQARQKETRHKVVNVRQSEPRRRSGRLTVTQALGTEENERTRSLASMKRLRAKKKASAELNPTQKVIRDVVIPESITVQELANRLAERSADVVKALMRSGIMATITQTIDGDTAEVIATELGHNVRRVADADIEIGLRSQDDDSTLLARPPVVTIMGHVDHGKTSLLDALRKTDVAVHEAGGITQHIGAYQVVLQSGQKITFVDTPGHAAFTEMRARGANVTDIVVLVVAADDGIMEQTVEAIHHAKAAGVPIIVAINKMDKPDANPDRVRTMLMQHEIFPESMGGEVLDIEVSAKKGTNLDKLEEAILLQAEILELKANPMRTAEGAVVEARLEKGRGSVATVLVQKGTLRVGDVFIAGHEYGRVRALVDDKGKPQSSALPSTPIEVIGFNGTPSAGDDFVVVENETRAKEIAEYRQRQARFAKATLAARSSMEQMFSKISSGDVKELSVVIKSDVQGSLEAIIGSLYKLATEEVKVTVLHSAVGGITESDVALAKASNALIIGFNVRANPQAREVARRDGIELRYYSIIYDVIEDARAVLTGLLAPTVKEKFIGNAEIREVFSISKLKIAGCMVTEGIVKRGAKVRLLRDNVVIHEGSLKTLKRFKDEVKEAREGYECGMAFENYNDIKLGDIIECFEMEEVTRTL